MSTTEASVLYAQVRERLADGAQTFSRTEVRALVNIISSGHLIRESGSGDGSEPRRQTRKHQEMGDSLVGDCYCGGYGSHFAWVADGLTWLESRDESGRSIISWGYTHPEWGLLMRLLLRAYKERWSEETDEPCVCPACGSEVMEED